TGASNIKLDISCSDVREIVGEQTMRFFFFQAEDGIRDKLVTGVQTCALPIWLIHVRPVLSNQSPRVQSCMGMTVRAAPILFSTRSEERRVGKECRSRWALKCYKKKSMRRGLVIGGVSDKNG